MNEMNLCNKYQKIKKIQYFNLNDLFLSIKNILFHFVT